MISEFSQFSHRYSFSTLPPSVGFSYPLSFICFFPSARAVFRGFAWSSSSISSFSIGIFSPSPLAPNLSPSSPSVWTPLASCRFLLIGPKSSLPPNCSYCAWCRLSCLPVHPWSFLVCLLLLFRVGCIYFIGCPPKRLAPSLGLCLAHSPGCYYGIYGACVEGIEGNRLNKTSRLFPRSIAWDCRHLQG